VGRLSLARRPAKNDLTLFKNDLTLFPGGTKKASCEAFLHAQRGQPTTFTTVRPPLGLNSTVPSAVANRVWSEPMPTLAPGWKLVPR
jgi:hypothetical protein